MNSDTILYIKAVILVGIVAFSVATSIYFIDQYFYRKMTDFYLAEINDSYENSDNDVEIMVKKSVALKKEHFKKL